MPLDQSGILPGRRIRSSQVSDLYDLLTGVMTDQPVTLADGLTVVGTFTATSSVFEASSATAVALIAQGTLAQTADIFQVKSYSGGTYFRVDAGGTVWYGTAAVTTNPMTAAADLIVGGAAGVPTRLGKGSALQYLRTNAGTTALEWAALTAPTTLGAVTLTAAAPGTPVADTLYKESTVKAWCRVNVSGGTPTLVNDFNVTSITDSGTGDLTVTWETDFANVNYTTHVNTDNGGWANLQQAASILVGSCRYVGYTSGGSPGDPAVWVISAFGQQS